MGSHRHEYLQAVEHRREGTIAAQELGRVNHTARATQFFKPDAMYNRFYDTVRVKEELAELKKEAEAAVSASMSAMEEGTRKS